MVAIGALALITFLGTLAIARINHARLVDATEDLHALQETEDQLLLRAKEASSDTPNEGKIPDEAIWAFADIGQTEAALQQVLLNAANEAGLSVVSFGASAPPQAVKVPTIAYEIEAEGGHGEVAQFIESLEGVQPRLALSYLWVRQMAGLDGQFVAPVSLRLAVWGFLPPEVSLE